MTHHALRRAVPAALVMAAIVAASGCSGDEAPAPPAATYRIDPDSITVSGISSGGFMATQLQVAHSSRIAGAGIIAAGPYYCAEGSLTTALGACINPPEPPEAATGIAHARERAESGAIDDVAGLGDDRVWLFHGTADGVVARPVVEALADFYRAYVPDANIELVTDVEAAHLMPTDGTGGACAETAAPFIGNCGYDAAGALLEHLYGSLTQPGTATGELVDYDQRAAADGAGSKGLADSGYLFVPTACATGATCRLHVALHGCEMGSDSIGDAFASTGGYNRWAAANDIVVMYPQVRKSRLPLNPAGCWDWWGYDGDDYATREGSQVKALFGMIEALIAGG